MATLSLNPFCNGRRDNGLTKKDILSSRTGLADEKLDVKRVAEASRWRCDSVCMQQTPVCDSSPQFTSWPHVTGPQKVCQQSTLIDLFDLVQATAGAVVQPPPPYTAAIADAPPSYGTLPYSLQQKHIQAFKICQVQICNVKQWHAKNQTSAPPIYPMKPVAVDLDDTSTFRQAKGKAAQKKTQKQSDQAKWADGGGEGANEGGDGGNNAGGGGGGGSNNGDGGAGDDGGGWDDWGAGGGKKNKKKAKKGKNNLEEEEEEEKKKEEEEKKQSEENANGGANDLSWMDDAAPKAGSEWEGFTTNDKKGKKTKKGKTDAVPETTFNAFEDINLSGGDTLDLKFGNNPGTKAAGSGFGFGVGGFGSSWDTGNSWGFSGLGNGATDITDSTKDASGVAEDTGTWGFGKKNKKTTTTSGFDFGEFTTIEEGGEAQANPAGDQDDWGAGFTASSKKNKKNTKKNAVEDSSTATDTTAIGTAVTDPTTADDSWSAWGTSSSKKDKDKNKKKKNESEPNDIPPVPPPPPPISEEPPADDTWSSFGTKSKKKNNKKGLSEEVTKVDDPIVVLPETEPEVDAGWGSFDTKKTKKKGKKDGADDKKTEPDPVIVVGDAEADSKAGNDIDWGFTSKKDKDKKKGKKGAEEDKPKEPAIVEVPEKEDDLDLGWPGFGTAKDKKKGKKDTAKDIAKEPAVTVVPDPEPEADLGWGGFGAKKDKKKGKKAVEEVEPQDENIVAGIADPEPFSSAGWNAFGSKKEKEKKKSKFGANEDFGEESHVDKVPDPEPVIEDAFDTSWAAPTTKKGKKDKKGGITEVVQDTASVVGSAAAAEAATKVAADDDWSNWASADKKKDKKGKKSAADVKKDEALPPPPPPPPPPPDPEPPSADPWAAPKKDKKGKKGKVVEPEPAIIAVPDPPRATEEAAEDNWGTFGLSAKDKKKKEKEKKEKEEKAKKEQEELERLEKEEAEREEKEAKEKEKEKAKPGKKGKAGTTTSSSKTKDLMADSVPDAAPIVEDDFSTSMWGSTKKDSKKKLGKKDPFEVPPPVPTPPAQGLTPPPEDPLDDLMGDDWGNFGTAKDKAKKDGKKTSKAEESKASKTTTKDKLDDEKAKVESAAKSAKSFWGGMTATPATSKSKSTKDKASDKVKKEADIDEELDLDEIVDIIEEEPPPKKGSKSKTPDSKLAKTSSKEDKASKSSASEKKAKADAEIDALIDFDEFETKDSKSKTADAAKSKGDDQKADAWSFWGSAKKPSGKKGDEGKKEINKAEATNQLDPLAFLSNEPEVSPIADEPAQSQPPKPSKSAMSTSKSSSKSAVAQKIKALEEEKKKALEPPAPPPVVDTSIEAPAKKTSAANKSKGSDFTRGAVTSKPTSSAFASKKKDLSPPAEEEKKKSKDSVPGGFPDDEENLIDMLASSPVEKKSAKKGTKTVKKESARAKDTMDVDTPVIPAAPPTPPTEPTAPKPVKKERARVVRDQGASSWGFWGAAPKKDEKKGSKAKDDADVPPAKKAAPPALSRSKSTKTAKEKDRDIEKSSSSDTKEKKAETRPSKSRGSSFGAFFGAPPPARSKPTGRMSTSAASKTTSKRQSMDIDAFGLPSPPPEDAPAASGKAAKVMGTTSGKPDRKASNKGKQKAPLVHDPYPIDDDDMVMVNGIEDPIINAPIPKHSKPSRDKSSKSKSRKDPKPAVDGDDVVMVDGPSQEEPELLAFDEKPRGHAPLKRSTTSAKKPQTGKLAGLFGGFGKTRRNSETLERPKVKAIITDDEAISPRKRTVNGREDSSKRIRRDDRKVRRTDRTDHDTGGFVTDALNDGGAVTELDDAEVRRQERRARRDARDPDDRHARRAEREADDGHKAKASDRRSKREEERPAKESTKHPSSRPHKSDRRRSYMDPPSTDARPKAHRSRTEQSSRKRHSVAAAGGAIIEDYFDSRNAPAEAGRNNEPYMHGANDHTSSWVKSQLSDPADPPPVEGTVIEPTPELGGKGGYEKGDEDGKRAARKARRQSRYVDDGDGDGERRRRRQEKESDGDTAEWGGKEREKLGRRHTDMGGVKLDGRPSLGAAGKRGSWLKKVTGLGI